MSKLREPDVPAQPDDIYVDCPACDGTGNQACPHSGKAHKCSLCHGLCRILKEEAAKYAKPWKPQSRE